MSKKDKRERQQRLLKEFEGDYYQEKFIDGKWLVKMFNRENGKWQIASFSESSFRRYKGFSDDRNRLNYLLEKD